MTDEKIDRADIVIMGGGPAGLFCALRTAQSCPGARIIVLEKMNKSGRKLLAAGSGRCNLTNSTPFEQFCKAYGNKERFVSPALRHFSPSDLCAFFAGHGLPLTELHDGKIFPETMKSTDVLRVLLDACRAAGAEIRTGSAVRSVEKTEDGFTVQFGPALGAASETASLRTDGGAAPKTTSDGAYQSAAVSCRFLVIASGGSSWPVTGSTGDGYALASSLGHTIIPPKPSLAPVYPVSYDCASCSGFALQNCTVSLYRGSKKTAERSGDVLFTHTGLSGPGILDFSRDFLPEDEIRLNLLSACAGNGQTAQSALTANEGRTPEEADTLLAAFCAQSSKKALKNILGFFGLPEALALAVLRRTQADPASTGAVLSKQIRKHIAELLCGFSFTIRETGGFTEAMATAGGVDTSEVNRTTMESRKTPSLFFAGEVLDVDGDTGGYNLQFAFSSAALAADTIAKQTV